MIGILPVAGSLAQDRLGMVNSNYAGLNGLNINPSSASNSFNYYEFQLLGGGIFFDNNYIYIPRKENRLKEKINLTRRAFILDFPGFYDDDYIFSDRHDPIPKNGFTDVKIIGPGIMYSANSNAFAVQLANRFLTLAGKVPHNISKLAYEHWHYPPYHGVRFLNENHFTIQSASWLELGLTYARLFEFSRELNISAGITAKRLWSYHGINISSNMLDYMFTNSDTLYVYQFDGKTSIALPFDLESNQFKGIRELFQGKGLAFDLGFTIVKKITNGHKYHSSKHNYAPYYYRFGLSLLDIGMIRYNRNARSLKYINASGQWTSMDNSRFENINTTINNMVEALGSADNYIIESESFSMWLPSSLSMQFDYAPGNDFFVNIVWIQHFRFSTDQLSRPSLIGLAPRFENKLFEMAVPLALVRYHEPRIGLALRLGFLTVGTDRLGAFFGMNDFEGFDIYFSMKYGFCKKHYQNSFNRFEQCTAFF